MVRFLLAGDTNLEVIEKDDGFLELFPNDMFDAQRSPRALNTHYWFDELPTDVLEKKPKIIFILRNPKDVSVSYFNHHKSITEYYEYNGSWNNYLPLVLDGRGSSRSSSSCCCCSAGGSSSGSSCSSGSSSCSSSSGSSSCSSSGSGSSSSSSGSSSSSSSGSSSCSSSSSFLSCFSFSYYYHHRLLLHLHQYYHHYVVHIVLFVVVHAVVLMFFILLLFCFCFCDPRVIQFCSFSVNM